MAHRVQILAESDRGSYDASEQKSIQFWTGSGGIAIEPSDYTT